MAFQRGDVLLVPFPFSNLSATKVRLAVVVSSPAYHASEPDFILAASRSNIAAASRPMDCILQDWQAAGLRYPSARKPVLFALDPARIVHRVGSLTPADLVEVDERLHRALG